VVVGILSLDLLIPESDSLKDKRRVLNRMLDRLHNDFNVSAAEVGDNDVWRRTQVGVACVANSRAHIESVLQSVRRRVESDPRIEIVHAEVDWA
jgi:hypothetical protein